MSKRRFLRPARPGLKVHHDLAGGRSPRDFIEASGEWLPSTLYYIRRLADGSLVECAPEAIQSPAPAPGMEDSE